MEEDASELGIQERDELRRKNTAIEAQLNEVESQLRKHEEYWKRFDERMKLFEEHVEGNGVVFLSTRSYICRGVAKGFIICRCRCRSC